jgi:hypothetical protein
MAKDLFSGFTRKTADFRAKLEDDIAANIREFCPTDADMIHYTERWIEEVKDTRQIGYSDSKYIDTYEQDVGDEDGGDEDDKKITDAEMLEKMIAFLDAETTPMVEMFGQIDTRDHPTIIEEEDYGRLLDWPYRNSVAVWQFQMLNTLNGYGSYGLHTPEKAFVANVLNDEVERWMTRFAKEYLQGKME